MTFLLLTRVILKVILACRVFLHESFEWFKGKEKLSSFDWSMDSPDPYHECSRLDECRRYVCLQWSCPLCPSTCLNWWLWAQSTLLENLSFPHCHHRGVKCRRTAQVCTLLIDPWILQIHIMNVQDLMNFEDMYVLNDLAFCVQVLAWIGGWAQSTLLENLSFPHRHHRGGVKCRRTAQVCALCFSGESRPSDRLSVPIFGEELLRVSNPRRLCEGRRNLLDIVSVHWSIMSRTGLDRLS